MEVLVIGAGLAGVTSAWYLAQAGCKVTVVDRQPGPGLETSFANGGQISVSHPEPWANPSAPGTILRWLGREDAPLLFRIRADAAQWRWGLSFLHECLPRRAARNTAAIASLAIYSRQQLRALRQDTGLRYESREGGILHLFEKAAEAARLPQRLDELEALGIHGRILSPAEAVEVEPALAALGPRLRRAAWAGRRERQRPPVLPGARDAGRRRGRAVRVRGPGKQVRCRPRQHHRGAHI